ncbi:protease modulator HflC [Pokkaliibacter plantistimulans]|uniref:protease modulator HflC n=1 Tax=Pokkaliibacter plantistimulans TaxID=1635171 RepID=UPI001A9C86DB|nr:protease modulator HflC [Pokkaliibacter plantistimulans]
MGLPPDHRHDDHSHDHEHNHHHEHVHAHSEGHAHPAQTPSPTGHHHSTVSQGLPWRMPLALLLLLLAVAAACLVQVRAGEATVITRFGKPVRVLLDPGLAWKLPLPIDAVQPVDLHLRTTSSGLQDVGTRDGLRIVIQAYVNWHVATEPTLVQRYLRAVQNQPDEAAEQIRTFVASALETTTSAYDLASLINTDAKQVQLDNFERNLQQQLAPQLLAIYGIQVEQVGIETLTLPAVTLSATVDRMRAERETIATQRTAEGKRQAALIRADADKQSRIIQADARVDAARIEAQAQLQAARIYGDAYAAAPALYQQLRSLDTLEQVISPNTRLVLRTDAAPFNVLTQPVPTQSGTASTTAPSSQGKHP